MSGAVPPAAPIKRRIQPTLINPVAAAAQPSQAFSTPVVAQISPVVSETPQPAARQTPMRRPRVVGSSSEEEAQEQPRQRRTPRVVSSEEETLEYESNEGAEESESVDEENHPCLSITDRDECNATPNCEWEGDRDDGVCMHSESLVSESETESESESESQSTDNESQDSSSGWIDNTSIDVERSKKAFDEMREMIAETNRLQQLRRRKEQQPENILRLQEKYEKALMKRKAKAQARRPQLVAVEPVVIAPPTSVSAAAVEPVVIAPPAPVSAAAVEPVVVTPVAVVPVARASQNPLTVPMSEDEEKAFSEFVKQVQWPIQFVDYTLTLDASLPMILPDDELGLYRVRQQFTTTLVDLFLNLIIRRARQFPQMLTVTGISSGIFSEWQREPNVSTRRASMFLFLTQNNQLNAKNIVQCRRLLLPVVFQFKETSGKISGHWGLIVLFITAFSKTNSTLRASLQYFDSIASMVSTLQDRIDAYMDDVKFMVEQACMLQNITLQLSSTPVYNNAVPQQSNNIDCGVFVCATMECVASAQSPFDYSQSDIPTIRHRLRQYTVQNFLPPRNVRTCQFEIQGKTYSGIVEFDEETTQYYVNTGSGRIQIGTRQQVNQQLKALSFLPIFPPLSRQEVVLVPGGAAASVPALMQTPEVAAEAETAVAAAVDEAAVAALVAEAQEAGVQESKASERATQSLFQYQEDGVRWLKAKEAAVPIPPYRRGGVLADEPGVGKTLQIVTLIKDDSSPTKTLLSTPASVLHQWKEQLEKAGLNIFLLKGTQWASLSLSGSSRPFVYLVSHAKIKDINDVRQQAWSRIVVDEAHESGKEESVSFKSFLQLRLRNPEIPVWLLTGTPVVNDLKDVYSLYARVNGIERLKGSKVGSEEELVLATEWLLDNTLQRRVADLRTLYPTIPFAPVHEEITMSLNITNPDELKFYTDMNSLIVRLIQQLEEEAARSGIDEATKERLRRARRRTVMRWTEQLNVHPDVFLTLRAAEEEAKTQATKLDKELVQEIRTDDFGDQIEPLMLPASAPPIQFPSKFHGPSIKMTKTLELMEQDKREAGAKRWLVYAWYKEEVRILLDFFSRQPLVGRVRFYNSEVTSAEKEAIVTSYANLRQGKTDEHDPLPKGLDDVLILNLKSGGVGLNLQNFTRVVFLTHWWTDAAIKQAIARAVRLTQQDVVKVWFLRLNHQIEQTQQMLSVDDQRVQRAKAKATLSEEMAEAFHASLLTPLSSSQKAEYIYKLLQLHKAISRDMDTTWECPNCSQRVSRKSFYCSCGTQCPDMWLCYYGHTTRLTYQVCSVCLCPRAKCDKIRLERDAIDAIQNLASQLAGAPRILPDLQSEANRAELDATRNEVKALFSKLSPDHVKFLPVKIALDILDQLYAGFEQEDKPSAKRRKKQ